MHDERSAETEAGVPEAAYTYRAYGLTLRTTLQLPEFTAVSPTALPDVVIRHRDLPPVPDAVTERAALSVRVQDDDVHYVWKHYGQFLLRAGRAVYYTPLPGAADATVRAPLLGVVLGTVLHQRGLFTLHASAVGYDGGVVAFVGPKGAGKSTTSAALHQRGYRLVTDDVLAVEVPPEPPPVVQPAFPRIKLCPDALAALGHSRSAFPALHDRIDKRIYPADRGFRNDPAPLRRIYVLSDGPVLQAERLSAKEAFMQLLSHSYAARFLGAEGAGRHHFYQCRTLVQHVPLYRLQRPRDLSALPHLLDFIASELGSPPESE